MILKINLYIIFKNGDNIMKYLIIKNLYTIIQEKKKERFYYISESVILIVLMIVVYYDILKIPKNSIIAAFGFLCANTSRLIYQEKFIKQIESVIKEIENMVDE